MTFRTKLTLVFTLLVAAVFSIMSPVIYFFAQRYTTTNFYEQLQDRVFTAAHVYLEEDELSTKSYKKVLRKYQRSLTDEQTYIYGQNRTPAFESDKVELEAPEALFDRLDKTSILFFEKVIRNGWGCNTMITRGSFMCWFLHTTKADSAS